MAKTISDYPPRNSGVEVVFDTRAAISFDKKLEYVECLLKEKVKESFEVLQSSTWEEQVKVFNDYGYQMKTKVFLFQVNKEMILPKMKWGFSTEEFPVRFDSFEDQYCLPDREEMNKIVWQSYAEHNNYIMSVIAKMKIFGITHVLKIDKAIFQVIVDESCISKNKKHAIDHIYLYPCIRGGTVGD